jgi:hypothetical protein
MNRDQFDSSLLQTNTRMQATSSRASLDIDISRRKDWGRDRWIDSPDFIEPEESLENPEDGIELPFPPGDRGKGNIRDALSDISSFQNAEKERIYRHAKEFYTGEYEGPHSFGIIDICQILHYAEENGHEDWLTPLKEQIRTFFDGIEENSLFLRIPDEDDTEDLDIEEIRETMQNRYRSMREATEEVYGSPDEEPNSRVINEAQKSYLWVLLESSDEFSNLPLE